MAPTLFPARPISTFAASCAVSAVGVEMSGLVGVGGVVKGIGGAEGPLSSDHGTCETAKARFWSCAVSAVGVGVRGVNCGVWGAQCQLWGLGCRVECGGFRVVGLGLGLGLGLRVGSLVFGV